MKQSLSNPYGYSGADGVDEVWDNECEYCDHTFTAEVYIEGNNWYVTCPQCKKDLEGELDK
jgi:hypothetical protein